MSAARCCSRCRAGHGGAAMVVPRGCRGCRQPWRSDVTPGCGSWASDVTPACQLPALLWL